MKDTADIRDQIREEQKQKNREQMPEIAKLMDQINAKYPGSKLIWAKDLTTGKEIGKKTENANLVPLKFYGSTTGVSNVRKGRSKTR
jgi:hypothetical protein